MPRFATIPGLPRLHTTPLATIRVAEGRVTIEADDERQKRTRFACQPFQALRVVTDDCFDPPGGLTIVPNSVVEVVDSSWLVELADALKRHDSGGTFMEKARHFVFPLQDEFLEVVAWDVRVEPVD